MVNIHNKKIKNHPVFILTPSMLPSMAAARWLEGVCVWGGGDGAAGAGATRSHPFIWASCRHPLKPDTVIL